VLGHVLAFRFKRDDPSGASRTRIGRHGDTNYPPADPREIIQERGDPIMNPRRIDRQTRELVEFARPTDRSTVSRGRFNSSAPFHQPGFARSERTARRRVHDGLRRIRRKRLSRGFLKTARHGARQRLFAGRRMLLPARISPPCRGSPSRARPER